SEGFHRQSSRKTRPTRLPAFWQNPRAALKRTDAALICSYYTAYYQCLESMDGTNVQRTDHYLCHTQAKETVGKAQQGGKVCPWRRLLGVQLMRIWFGMKKRMKN